MEQVNQIQDAIWDCIDFLVKDSNEVIWMDTDGQRPSLLYTTLKITPYDTSQNDEYINLPDGNIKQITRFSLVLSVQMYRAGALNSAIELSKKLRQKSVLDYCAVMFHQKGLCLIIREVSQVRDITQLVETNQEERAQFDVVLNFSSATIDKGVDGLGLGAIFPISITGKYKDSEEDINPITKTTVIDK